MDIFKFSEIHSTLPEKNIFVSNFLMDSLKTKSPLLEIPRIFLDHPSWKFHLLFLQYP